MQIISCNIVMLARAGLDTGVGCSFADIDSSCAPKYKILPHASKEN